jgi:hypothetical protein
VNAMEGEHGPILGFGPVGVAGIVLLLLGILSRRRILALLGLGAVVADMTKPELGGFAALNQPADAGPVAPEL